MDEDADIGRRPDAADDIFDGDSCWKKSSNREFWLRSVESVYIFEVADRGSTILFALSSSLSENAEFRCSGDFRRDMYRFWG